LLVQEPIADIAVEGVQSAQPKTWIRPAQIFLHFPDDASVRDDKGFVNVARQLNAPMPVLKL
jgi:hypothetical protein